jgi:hypothetical protein
MPDLHAMAQDARRRPRAAFGPYTWSREVLMPTTYPKPEPADDDTPDPDAPARPVSQAEED